MMSSFTNQYLIQSEDWFYLDLRSNLNNYDEFNYCLKLSRDNDFRSTGVIFCGVKEHQRDKKGIHAHLAVVPPSESFDGQMLKDGWRRHGEGFTSKIRDPYGHDPFGYIHYWLKAVKGFTREDRVKVFGKPSSFITHCNLRGHEPWRSSPMPSKHFSPNKLERIVRAYFHPIRNQAKHHIRSPDCIQSIFNFTSSSRKPKSIDGFQQRH